MGSTNTMPFTGHSCEELHSILEWLKTTELPEECLDAFLSDYKETGNLASARFFALQEWDC